MEKEKFSFKNRFIISIVVFFIALGLSLGFIAGAIESFKSYGRIVSVKGLCEREVAADRVIWPLVYKIVGNNLEELYSEINSKNDIVVQFLLSQGLSKEEISISAPKIIDMDADRYTSNKPIYRYNVTSVVTVFSSKIDLVREVMNRQVDILKKGIAISGGDYQYPTQYLFTGLNAIKPEMLSEATENARQSALTFAKDSKSKLGKIKRAKQGQVSISNRDANTPYIKSVRVVISVDYLLKN